MHIALTKILWSVAVCCVQDASYQSEDELHVGLTEEQKLQKQLDAQNIKVNLTVKGDGVNFPVGSLLIVLASLQSHEQKAVGQLAICTTHHCNSLHFSSNREFLFFCANFR